MCCICSLLCKLISFIITLLFVVALVLLILWLTGVIFGSDDSNDNNARYIEGVTGAGLKHFAST